MGQIKKGILGSFSGKVGTVVGSHWKQIDYIRSMPSHHHDAKTPKQMEQRLKLALLSEYLKIMLPFVDIGFKNNQNNTSPFNAAFKYNFANAFYGDYPNIQLDLAYILLSHGSTKGTDYAHISAIHTAITITWRFNASTENGNDTAMIVAVNYLQNKCVFQFGAKKRSNLEAIIEVPSDWVGCGVSIFLAFRAEDEKDISNSMCLGTVFI